MKLTSLSLAAGALALVFTLAACSKSTPVASPNAGLGLASPVSLNDIRNLQDGGTISIRLADAAGKTGLVVLDGRFGSPTRGRVFIGADYPSAPGAKLAPTGSPLEAEIVRLLKEAAGAKADPARQQQIAGTAVPGSLSNPADKQVWWLLHVIRTVEKGPTP